MQTERTNREQLAETACTELLSYGSWDIKTYIKRAVSRVILRRNLAPRDLIFWPTGLLAAGLWNYRSELVKAEGQDKNAELEEKILNALELYYDRWISKGMKVNCLDDLLAGETLLAMQQERAADTGKDYGRALETLAEFARQHPTDETGSFPYRVRKESQENGYVFVDTIGLACPFLYRYGEVYGRQEFQEIAVRQIANYLAYGMDEQHDLPYHGYDLKAGCKYGIIGWGRAVGWLLRGMNGCMQSAYGREKLESFYGPIVDRVLQYQRQDGYFSWQLQAMEGPKDSSATAMIGVGLQGGIRLGILMDEKYKTALEACKEAVGKSVREGRVYDCSAECEGFAQYPQRYGAYPWALGPGMEIL